MVVLAIILCTLAVGCMSGPVPVAMGGGGQNTEDPAPKSAQVENDFDTGEANKATSWDHENTLVSADKKWSAITRVSEGTDSEFDLIGPNGFLVTVKHASALEFSPDSSLLVYNAETPDLYKRGLSALFVFDLSMRSPRQVTNKNIPEGEDFYESSAYTPHVAPPFIWDGNTISFSQNQTITSINLDTGEIESQTK